LSLLAVLGALAGRLEAALDDDVTVGDSAPAAADDLPAVTLGASDVTERLAGIGRIPRGTRTGALALEQEIDLANPVLDLGGGETLQLLSADRRTLILPNGPLVRADGVGEPPFAAADLRARNGGDWTNVSGDPGPGEVRPDIDEGVLRFGAALPGSGQLSLRYHVGQWDVTVSRYQGVLDVSVAAATAEAVRTLVADVDAALAERHADVRLAPRGSGASSPTELGTESAHVRQLSYRFDAELEEPVLTSGGGVITRIAVDVHVDDAAESFAVAREGSPA
jgi:hypothetical protein